MSKKREHHKLFMVGSDAPFQFTEAYKSLRTNLEFLAATSRLQDYPDYLSCPRQKGRATSQ